MMANDKQNFQDIELRRELKSLDTPGKGISVKSFLVLAKKVNYKLV